MSGFDLTLGGQLRPQHLYVAWAAAIAIGMVGYGLLLRSLLALPRLRRGPVRRPRPLVPVILPGRWSMAKRLAAVVILYIVVESVHQHRHGGALWKGRRYPPPDRGTSL